MATFSIQSMSPQLPVADIDRAIRFYTEKLDFQLAFRYEEFYAGIVKDGCSIHLKMGDTPPRKTGEDLDLVFSVGNVEELHTLLVSRAVDIRQPPREMPYGKEIYVADPEGNILAFLQSQ